MRKSQKFKMEREWFLYQKIFSEILLLEEFFGINAVCNVYFKEQGI